MKQPYPESHDKMSIDLKAHGLRVKPLEWLQEGRHRYIALVNGKALGRIDYIPVLSEWRISNATSSDFYIDEVAAKNALQKSLESQVLALLEQVEGGQ